MPFNDRPSDGTSPWCTLSASADLFCHGMTGSCRQIFRDRPWHRSRCVSKYRSLELLNQLRYVEADLEPPEAQHRVETDVMTFERLRCYVFGPCWTTCGARCATCEQASRTDPIAWTLPPLRKDVHGHSLTLAPSTTSCCSNGMHRGH